VEGSKEDLNKLNNTISMIIDKQHIFPIILDIPLYQDRFGSPNRFIEMNPSIYIKETGDFIILVRTVNYLKYKDNKFQIYGSASESKYYIIRGQLHPEKSMNLDNYTCSQLEIQYNIPRQPSLWYGIEDIRFINENSVLTCIPECNGGRPGIFKGTLNGSTIRDIVKCEPFTTTEKNWMPYCETHVVYSVNPFTIKDIVYDIKEIIYSDSVLDGWHGSSNAIDAFGEKLFLIHKNRDKVYSKWLLYNPKTKYISHSKEFVFFKDSYIEFTCSLAKYNNRIFVGLGVNDSRAFIVEIKEDTIVKLFGE
jgi:predicted GH43/DUF377 family glycosyl hydrolase